MLPNSRSTFGPRISRAGAEASMTEHPFVGFAAAATLSLLAHGFAYASLGLAPEPPRELPPMRVSFRVHDAAPEPPPLATPRPESPRLEPARAKPKAKSPNVPPPLGAPAPQVVDLRGVTLTNDSGASTWSSAVGDGSALQGPLGPVGAVAAHGVPVPPEAPVAARAPETTVVA